MRSLGLLLLASLAGADDLATYRELDQAQRSRPRDAATTKAWLDEAGRLATLAAGHIENGRYAEARRLLRATGRPLSQAPSWNNLLGYSEFKLGNAKPALDYLQRALRLDPDNEDYLLDLGEFLGQHRAYDEAVRVFEVAARRMPHSPRVIFGLAVSYILQNRGDQAQVLLEQLLASQPRFEPVYKALGECYEDRGNAAAMIELGRKLQTLNSGNPLGWYLEGAGSLLDARRNSASLHQAVAAFQKSLALDPANSRAHFLLSRAWQEANDDPKALIELKETLRLDPDHERAHYVLARLYQKLGDADSARREFESHKQIKERDRKAQYRRLLISIRQ